MANTWLIDGYNIYIYIWLIYGQHMVNIWLIYGKYMVYGLLNDNSRGSPIFFSESTCYPAIIHMDSRLIGRKLELQPDCLEPLEMLDPCVSQMSGVPEDGKNM